MSDERPSRFTRPWEDPELDDAGSVSPQDGEPTGSDTPDGESGEEPVEDLEFGETGLDDFTHDERER